MTTAQSPIPVRLRSTDGREIRIEFGHFSLNEREAAEFMRAISDAVLDVERAHNRHERHVNLVASCVLCRFEAGAQTDRLDWTR